MAIAKLAELEFYYEVQGSGEPVLLAPASWWPSATWNVGVVPFLSKRFKTITFDCRGTGREQSAADGYTGSSIRAGLHRGLLAHLGISRCHAVGFALGGQIVQAMAIERPDLVATLTIAASGAGTKTLAGGQRSLSPDTEREIHAIGFERYIRNYIENDTMAFNPKFYREAWRGGCGAGRRRVVGTEHGGNVSPPRRRASHLGHTWGRPRKCKVPTLILCGADDDVAPARQHAGRHGAPFSRADARR